MFIRTGLGGGVLTFFHLTHKQLFFTKNYAIVEAEKLKVRVISKPSRVALFFIPSSLRFFGEAVGYVHAVFHHDAG